MVFHILIVVLFAGTSGALDQYENYTTLGFSKTVDVNPPETPDDNKPYVIAKNENVSIDSNRENSIAVIDDGLKNATVTGRERPTTNTTIIKASMDSTKTSSGTPKPTQMPFLLRMALCVQKNKGYFNQNGKLAINITVTACCTYKIQNHDLNSLLRKDVHAATIIIDFWISIFVVFIGLVGNIVSFVVLSIQPVNTSLFLLKALSITDALYCLWYLMFSPYNTAFQYTNWVSNRDSDIVHWIPLNKSMLNLVNFVLQTISIWLVALLTIDRFITVCFPFKAKLLCTMNKVRLQVAILVWFSIMFCIPSAFQTKAYLYPNPCTGAQLVASYQTDFGMSYGSSMVYDIILDGFLRYIIPVTMVFAMNSLLIKALNKAATNRMQLSSDSNQKDNKNITMVLVTVATVFLILVLPHLGAKIMRTVAWLQKDKQISLAIDESVLTTALKFLMIASNLSLRIKSSINFFLYIVISQKFRKGFSKLIHCGRIHDVDSPSASPSYREIGPQGFQTRNTSYKTSSFKVA
ncbi:unnamed protein product [Owenia fusiformis]|uniref:Uncharacterized protein n=1 Tax=Owenia fusiformis TaxID=6347 RepID=A0A8J1UEW4_OWEFU|nr:unnamed protein product [Owenia fusiformis]